MPPNVRPADYEGPTELPVELSETDKKMIVKFYSEGIYSCMHVAILGTLQT